MKLGDKISKWEKEKIISAFQAQAILEYERRAGRPHFLPQLSCWAFFVSDWA